MSYPELREHYELQETLGSGGFAKVKAGIHKATGEKVAIKIMDKDLLGADLPRAYREIRALKKLRHQHISQLFQVIESETMIYLVIEFCPGGELFDYIVAKERLKEKEARAFFRQIVSALRYIHENGFVHRDLKPENLLLDDDSNIKLIDFGLVSEPDIDVTKMDPQKLLETCCGSPAYAAPELIKGGPYVGSRADIWSLGVLLYALLNGFLPFDDDHTPRLYHLIQQGEYEIPDWLTPGSVGIIARLLQTNPLERITVDGLMSDSWVTKGYGKPVDWKSRQDVDGLDRECVAEMARHYHKNEERMTEMIRQWDYDEVTAVYFLLLQKKNRGCLPTLVDSSRLHRSQLSDASCSTQNSSGSSIPHYESPLTSARTADGSISADSLEFQGVIDNVAASEVKLDDSPVFHPTPSENTAPVRSRRISHGQPIHPPTGELLTLLKPERPMHPVISTIKDEEHVYPENSSPLLNSFHPPVKPTASVPTSQTMMFNEAVPMKTKVVKTRSYESRLQYAVDDQRRTTLSPTSPQIPRRGRIGSFEGLFKKAKKVFATHRKPSESSGPRKVKGVYDISTTSRKDTQLVIQELEQALQQLNINFRKDGYVMKCSIASYKESTSHKKEKVNLIKFELEVCLLPRLEMLGVRRKRIRGDVWEFKRICDQIFKATHL